MAAELTPDGLAKLKVVLVGAVKIAKDLRTQNTELKAALPTEADATMLADALIRRGFLQPSVKAAAVQHLTTTKGLVDTLLNVTNIAAEAITTAQGASLPGTPTPTKQASDGTPRTPEEADEYAAREFSKLAAVAASFPTV